MKRASNLQLLTDKIKGLLSHIQQFLIFSVVTPAERDQEVRIMEQINELPEEALARLRTIGSKSASTNVKSVKAGDSDSD